MTRDVQDFDLCLSTTKKPPKRAAGLFGRLRIALLSVPSVWIYIRSVLFPRIF